MLYIVDVWVNRLDEFSALNLYFMYLSSFIASPVWFCTIRIDFFTLLI